MTRAAFATAVGSRLLGGGTAALLVIAAAALAVFLALLHAGFHVLVVAAGLRVFHFAFIFAATSHGFLAIGLVMMAATPGVFHVIAVMAAGLRFGSRS